MRNKAIPDTHSLLLCNELHGNEKVYENPAKEQPSLLEVTIRLHTEKRGLLDGFFFPPSTARLTMSVPIRRE
jgi:hypothetical protein